MLLQSQAGGQCVSACVFARVCVCSLVPQNKWPQLVWTGKLAVIGRLDSASLVQIPEEMKRGTKKTKKHG